MHVVFAVNAFRLNCWLAELVLMECSRCVCCHIHCCHRFRHKHAAQQLFGSYPSVIVWVSFGPFLCRTDIIDSVAEPEFYFRVGHGRSGIEFLKLNFL